MTGSLIAAILCLAYAWFPLFNNTVSKILWPPVEHGERVSESFAVLAYDDVTWTAHRRPDVVVREHIRSLEASGFSPISLADVQKLMYEGAPLPRNAILLTFDHCTRALCDSVKPALRQHGWNAVAFIATGDRTGTAKSRRRSNMSSIAMSRYWEVGAQGHDAYLPCPGQSFGDSSSHYLTEYSWLPHKGRFETADEFRRRIATDHARCSDLFFKQTSSRPIAFAYPHGDFGQYSARAAQIKKVNEEMVSKRYELAFVSSGLVLNTRYSNPYRLNRLRIQPEWSGRELLTQLKQAMGNAVVVEDDKNISSQAAWTVETGSARHSSDGLVLDCGSGAKEALIWLAGSDQFDEFTTSFSMDVVGGELNLRMLHSSEPSSYIRFGLSSKGEATLEQKEPLGTDTVLASSTVSMVSSNRHVIQVFLRGNRIFTRLNGQSVFDRGIERNLTIPSGLIGLGVRSTGITPAMLVVRDMQFKSQEPRLATWDSIDLDDSFIITWLHDNAGRLTDLAPPLPAPNEKDRYKERMARYEILANTYGLRMVPKVEIKERSPLISWSPARLADELAVSGYDGLFINMESCHNLSMEELIMWIRETGRYLRRVSRSVLVKVPSSLENSPTIREVVDSFPALSLVTRGNLRLLNEPGRVAAISEERVPDIPADFESAEPEHLAMESIPPFLSNEEEEQQLQRLQYMGERALHRHDYEHAIVLLSKWHERDPQNSRPLLLIGDALYASGFRDEALDFYRESLSVNPGQVRLAAKLADALAVQQRDEEARALLNRYVRLFPNDPEILYAQALWLLNHDRFAEARTRTERILAAKPYDFNALVLMLRVSSDEEQRQETIARLRKLGSESAYQMNLVEAIRDHNLLTLADTEVFVDLLSEIEKNTTSEDVREAIRDLSFRSDTVQEALDVGSLSPNWSTDGASITRMADGIVLAVEPTRTECSLRLKRTDRWRDCFVSTTVQDPSGGFWIYARHSIEGLIRFGFDSVSDGFRLQVWQGKSRRLVVNQHSPIRDKKGAIRMALEVRGNGIVALSDGEPLFSSPIEIPPQIGHGWVALVTRHEEQGRASVKITALEAGPLPVRIAMLPQEPSTTGIDEELQRLRALLGTVSDCSPNWFSIAPSGSWLSKLDVADDFFRLFARYYRIRLLPTVTVSPGIVPTGEEIISLAAIHRLDGFVLKFREMPKPDALEALEDDLSGHPVYVFVLTPGRAGSSRVKLLGLGRSRPLLNDSKNAVGATRLKADAYSDARDSDAFKQSPAVIILNPHDDRTNNHDSPDRARLGGRLSPASQRSEQLANK